MVWIFDLEDLILILKLLNILLKIHVKFVVQLSSFVHFKKYLPFYKSKYAPTHTYRHAYFFFFAKNMHTYLSKPETFLYAHSKSKNHIHTSIVEWYLSKKNVAKASSNTCHVVLLVYGYTSLLAVSLHITIFLSSHICAFTTEESGYHAALWFFVWLCISRFFYGEMDI